MRIAANVPACSGCANSAVRGARSNPGQGTASRQALARGLGFRAAGLGRFALADVRTGLQDRRPPGAAGRTDINAPLLTFYGFVPVALGGMGNNRGAVVAGLILGLFQQSANFLVGGIFASVAVFTVFIIVLLAFPEGLAGASVQRRV